MRAPVPSAETRDPMPDSTVQRLDRAERALRALDDETRRLERLGFELPLARCRESQRYWSFVHGLLSVASTQGGSR